MNYNMLIFDDGIGASKLVRSILSNQPFNIIEGNNNSSFSAQCKQHSADLVLLDFNISHSEDGYSICKKLKSQDSKIKVIIIFDTFDQPDHLKISESKIDNFIYRPFDGEKLVSVCRNAVGLESSKIINTSTLTKDNIVQTEKNVEDEIGGWEMIVPDVISSNAEIAETSDQFENHLVPGVITKEHQISQEPTNVNVKGDKFLAAQSTTTSSAKFPQQSDLEFPEEEETFAVNANSPSAVKEEKTSLVDLAQIAASQKDHLGKLKAQINEEVEGDFWKADETDVIPAEMSTGQTISQASSHMAVQAEEIFQKVEKQALKQEIMANVREHMLLDLKKEIMEELRSEIITNLSSSDREKIIEELKANVIKNMKDKIYQDLFLKLSKELHHEIWHKLKEELLASGTNYLGDKISDHFIKEVVPMLRNDVPLLAQELIQNELMRIRRLIDGE